MISPQKSDKDKDLWYLLTKKKLRAPSIKKYRNNNMHTFFYYNISEFAGNLEGIIDEVTYKTTIQNMHKFVGRHNSSSQLIYQCWDMVVMFYNILSFMTKLKRNIKCYHIHMWEAILVKRLGPSQDVTFLYTGSHLSELQSCALIFSTNFYFIFVFK